MNCPECGLEVAHATSLFMHVWEHREPRFKPGLYPCPWCGVMEQGMHLLGDRSREREKHLSSCLPYAASKLSGVAVTEDLVRLQIQRYLTSDKPHKIAHYESLFRGEEPCAVPAVKLTTFM